MSAAGVSHDVAVDERRVLIVDDQRAFAQSLEIVIDAQDDLVCVGSVATGEDALTHAIESRPTVVLMDVDLPGMDGVDATRALVEGDGAIGVVVLTGIPDATVLARAASAGACAFLLKDSSVSEILEAVRSAGPHGGLDVGSEAMEQILGPPGDGSAGRAVLTQRELEVLGLLAQGRQPKQIARSLGITVHTCRGYVKNVLAKLDAHSALEAVVEAHRRGIISLSAGGA